MDSMLIGHFMAVTKYLRCQLGGGRGGGRRGGGGGEKEGLILAFSFRGLGPCLVDSIASGFV